MACKATFDLYHNFPKLAEEAGFVFNTHRPRVQIDWNKIRLLDIESLIRERKFILIEQHLNDILDCVLESEFDVRILDEGVVKIFRLAQLAVEYQQFCRHYLDRSVYVLREEVTSLAKELEAHKNSLKEKEDEIRRLRRKSRHVIRTPLPYGSENIATMILNTLKNQSDIFPSAPHLDTVHQNKCQYCDKVFLNQFYLKSHMSRRHPNISEIPQKDVVKDVSENYPEDNNKLHTEIENLKTKLKEMENVIAQTHQPNDDPKINIENKINEVEKIDNTRKEMKDAEVLTHNGGYFPDRIEEFKKQEFDKYDKELSSLKTEIMHLIDSNKDKQNQNIKIESEVKLIEELQRTIKEQGVELVTLKQELLNSNSMKDAMKAERKKEVEIQMSNWVKKLEAQSNECKILLERLNDTAKEVHQYKTLANAERERASQLQELLSKQLQVGKTNDPVGNTSLLQQNDNDLKTKFKTNKSNPTADRVTLEKLQKQAQDLLNIEQSTTDLSTSSETSNNTQKVTKNITKDRRNEEVLSTLNTDSKHYEKSSSFGRSNRNKKKLVCAKAKIKKMKRLLPNQNGQAPVPISPVKVVRAKITEEVNQRLVQLGVDPLKNRLPKSTFQKQRTMLQEQQELKVKKYPSREKIYHSIVTHLDTNITIPQEKLLQSNSCDKANKAFSISSVISNVKTKALSLVKRNEVLINKNHTNTSHSVTDKALALLNASQNTLQTSTKNVKDVKSPISPIRYKPQKKEEKVRYKKKELSKDKHTANNKSSSSDDTQSDTSNHSQKSFNMESKSNSPKHQRTQSCYKISSDDICHSHLFNGKRNINSQQKTIIQNKVSNKIRESTSDDIESLDDIITPRKTLSEEILNPKQTKGVLRNASSTSSLNKKKVLFDMDAIQMKSISASPSQSFAEKSDNNENYTLGIINLDTEEWEPSSIEIENPINPTIQVSSRTTPRIAELKQVIESQMVRRIQTPSTALAGSVNVLPTPKPMVRTSLGGSNTSLGSSILDESVNLSLKTQNLIVSKEKNDGSEIDFSELLADDKDDQQF